MIFGALVGFGILLVVFGLISLIFLQTTVASIDVSHESIAVESDVVYLKARNYRIAIVGTHSADGYSQGTLYIYKVVNDQTYLIDSIDIIFNFDGESGNSVKQEASYTIEEAGEYVIEYIPNSHSFYRGIIKIALQYSQLEEVLGLNEMMLILVGAGIAVFGGILLFFVSVKPISKKDYQSGDVNVTTRRDRRRLHSYDEEPEYIFLDGKQKADDIVRRRGIECPFCGAKNQRGEYCKECNSGLMDT